MVYSYIAHKQISVMQFTIRNNVLIYSFSHNYKYSCVNTYTNNTYTNNNTDNRYTDKSYINNKYTDNRFTENRYTNNRYVNNFFSSLTDGG